jgi:hypothetical protein
VCAPLLTALQVQRLQVSDNVDGEGGAANSTISSIKGSLGGVAEVLGLMKRQGHGIDSKRLPHKSSSRRGALGQPESATAGGTVSKAGSGVLTSAMAVPLAACGGVSWLHSLLLRFR